MKLNESLFHFLIIDWLNVSVVIVKNALPAPTHKAGGGKTRSFHGDTSSTGQSRQVDCCGGSHLLGNRFLGSYRSTQTAKNAMWMVVRGPGHSH